MSAIFAFGTSGPIMLYSPSAAQAVSSPMHRWWNGKATAGLFVGWESLTGQPMCLPCFSFEESRAMRAFVQEWSPVIAALLVVLSIVYIGISIRTHTGGVQERLATLEKNIESIHNTIEGEQGIVVLLKSLDGRVNEQLQ